MSADTTGKKLLRAAEVAERLAVAEGTLRYWRYEGRGPRWFKLGPRRVVYDEADVDQWIEECRANSGGEA